MARADPAAKHGRKPRSGEGAGIEILPVGGVVARRSNRIPPSCSGVASRIWPLTATTGFTMTGPALA